MIAKFQDVPSRRPWLSRHRRLVVWASLVLTSATLSTAGRAMAALTAGGDGESAPAPTAQVLAGRVDKHYNALHSLRVNFVQQYDGMGMHRQETGVLLLKKPGRMRWNYAQPPGKLFVLDGKDAYFYSPGESTVQRVSAKKLDDLRSPLRLLLGHAQLAKELSNLQIAPSGYGGSAFELTGVPKGMEQRVESFQLTVTADGIIQAIRVEEKDGSVTRFSFTGEQDNVPASDSDFVFKAPPGVTVINGLPPV